MNDFEIPVAALGVPEILERIRVLPEHDPDALKPFALAHIPAGLPKPSGQTGGFARAVKKYRAHLRANPLDTGAWEGLGYLHLRMASGEGSGKGLGAEGLVSREVSDSPLRAGHQVLAVQCELQALLCAPHSTRARSSLNTFLSLALNEAVRENPYRRGHYAPVVQALGGVWAAQELRLSVLEGLLELHARSAEPLSRSQQAELLNDLALLHMEMGRHRQASVLLEQVLSLLDQERAAGEPLFTLNHESVYLYLHLNAMSLQDWARATAFLNLLEAEQQQVDQERVQKGEPALHDSGPATALRLELLEAQGLHEQARALAGRNADLLLERQARSGAARFGWGMVRCAELLHYAGRTQEAQVLLEHIVNLPDDRHTREYAQRTLDEHWQGKVLRA